MFRDIQVFKPTVLVFVPALAEMSLSLSKQFGRNMLGEDLKYIICGAAAVAPYLIEEYDKIGTTKEITSWFRRYYINEYSRMCNRMDQWR
jgi:hypothetical protein